MEDAPHGKFQIKYDIVKERNNWDVISKDLYEVLKKAAGFIASRNIRNMATLGGNIAANRPDSYIIPCLMALKAELGKRCEANIADLNKAYFADRDKLWKAYEAAFKTPKIMKCKKIPTQNPPIY